MPIEYRFRVSVTPEFLPDHTDVEALRYVFAYHITIVNEGQHSAQLQARHWWITDGNDRTEEVVGEGVVGEKPVINPGSTYHYSSFSILDTPVGMMYGTYQMVGEDGMEFEIEIPAFTLALPGCLN